MSPDREEFEVRETRSGALLRRLLRYARPYRGWMALSLLLLLAMAAAVNYLPVILREATDLWLVDASPSIDVRIRGLTHAGLLYLGLAGFGFLVRYAESMLTAWVGQRIVYDLRNDVFAKMLRLALPYFDRTPVGRTMTRVTTDVDAVQRFVTEGVVGALADVFMLVGVLGYMTYVNLRLTLCLLTILPVLFAAMTIINVRLRHANRKIRTRQSALNGQVQECLTGMTTIQLFNREDYARDRFGIRNRDLRAAQYEETAWFAVYFPLLEVAQAVSIIIILAAGGWSLARGTGGVTIGALVAFLAYVRDFYRPLGALSDKASSLQQAMASSERLFALLDREDTIADPAVPVEKQGLEGRLAFDKVSFAYEADHRVLEAVDLAIRPGESVAIVGATGAGKSTLISLIARFYDVQEGAVKVDGTDVRAYRKADLRRRVGVVLQEPFIFSGSVADNIGLGDPAIDRSRIRAAARFVNADRFIEHLPDGYDSLLAERGGSLSSGEKQLIALARVFARDPDVMLMFDEATANVDTETEALIRSATDRLMKGRTCLIIAHRLSTIRHVDRIIVMRRGRVIAQGTHEQLMEQGGYYRQLYDLLAHRPTGA